MRSIGQKWAYSITTIPGDQRHTVDHKQSEQSDFMHVAAATLVMS